MLVLKISVAEMGLLATSSERLLWPGQHGPAAKSNRYAQYFSTSSKITITHIQASTRSSENKEAPFSG